MMARLALLAAVAALAGCGPLLDPEVCVVQLVPRLVEVTPIDEYDPVKDRHYVEHRRYKVMKETWCGPRGSAPYVGREAVRRDSI